MVTLTINNGHIKPSELFYPLLFFALQNLLVSKLFIQTTNINRNVLVKL